MAQQNTKYFIHQIHLCLFDFKLMKQLRLSRSRLPFHISLLRIIGALQNTYKAC